VRAAQLLDRGFASNNGLAWLRPSLGTVDSLQPIDASPPNLRDEVCSGKHHKPASDEDDAPIVASAANGASTSGETGTTVFLAAGLQPPMPKPSEWLAAAPAPAQPIVVYTGPTRTGAALVAAVAADADTQAASKRGKRARVAARKPDAAAADASAKPAKPAVVHHANATAKPAAATDPAAKPKPKTSAKPKTGSGDAKPKSSSAEAKPAG